MSDLSHDDIHDIGEAGASHPNGKRFLKQVLDHLAIGQILREEYVYEVHGPFIAEKAAPPHPRIAAWMIAKLST